MRAILIINIGRLVNTRRLDHPLRGEEMAQLPSIDQAWLFSRNQTIHAFGKMSELPAHLTEEADEIFDAAGGYVLPAWCDSHTHLVFEGSREMEWIDKIKGMSYADIAARGGGILYSAKRVREATEETLYESALQRIREISLLGTGAVEIKSGYGLSYDAELKMLRVIKRLQKESGLLIKSTFLGAHALPPDYKETRSGYLQLLTEQLLPVISREGLADFIDAFCEQGFFSPMEVAQICEAGGKYGLRAKIHSNQFSSIGGVQMAVQQGAISVDHLETMDEEAISALANSPLIGTMLPSAAFFLRIPYPPARQMMKAGAALALASDHNPGSSPSGNMFLVVSLACIQMQMLPEEAINAATSNAAFAMGVQDQAGSIAIGKLASLIITKAVPSLAYIPYSFGSNLLEKVMIKGEWI
jgi:imidazolonepropionase